MSYKPLKHELTEEAIFLKPHFANPDGFPWLIINIFPLNVRAVTSIVVTRKKNIKEKGGKITILRDLK